MNDEKMDKTLRWIIIIFTIVILLSFTATIISANKHKAVCKSADLKFSHSDYNCYKEVSGGIIKYKIENVGFFKYKLNVQPIIPN